MEKSELNNNKNNNNQNIENIKNQESSLINDVVNQKIPYNYHKNEEELDSTQILTTNTIISSGNKNINIKKPVINLLK
jgi:hypothetical protein